MQAVVLGDSIAAYLRGGFPDFLAAACPNLELVNLSYSSLGARGLKRIFRDSVLRNPYLKKKPPGTERWLIFSGGVNSVGTPRLLIRHLESLFAQAHGAGWKVLGLSLTPWGSEKSTRYWKGLTGLDMHLNTQEVVDFILSRGSRLPRSTRRPDRAVDLFDSPLRSRAAPLRQREPLDLALRGSARWKRRLALLPELRRERRFQELLDLAVAVPRYYLDPSLHAFDSTHPNHKGHRIIARLTCPALPRAAGCDCALIEELHWLRSARGLVLGRSKGP